MLRTLDPEAKLDKGRKTRSFIAQTAWKKIHSPDTYEVGFWSLPTIHFMNLYQPTFLSLINGLINVFSGGDVWFLQRKAKLI